MYGYVWRTATPVETPGQPPELIGQYASPMGGVWDRGHMEDTGDPRPQRRTSGATQGSPGSGAVPSRNLNIPQF